MPAPDAQNKGSLIPLFSEAAARTVWSRGRQPSNSDVPDCNFLSQIRV